MSDAEYEYKIEEREKRKKLISVSAVALAACFFIGLLLLSNVAQVVAAEQKYLVKTGANSLAISSYSSQRNVALVNGWYVYFWIDNASRNNVYTRTSQDGSTWGHEQLSPLQGSETLLAGGMDVDCDGYDYVFVGVESIPPSIPGTIHYYWARGLVNDDGSITWDARRTVYTSGASAYDAHYVAVGWNAEDKMCWFASGMDWNVADYYLHIYSSSNNGSSWDWRLQTWSAGNNYMNARYVNIICLSSDSDDMWFFAADWDNGGIHYWKWDGSAFELEGGIVDRYRALTNMMLPDHLKFNEFSAVIDINNIVWFSYVRLGGQSLYQTVYTTGNNTWGAESQVATATATYAFYPSIGSDTVATKLHVYAKDGVLYSRRLLSTGSFEAAEATWGNSFSTPIQCHVNKQFEVPKFHVSWQESGATPEFYLGFRSSEVIDTTTSSTYTTTTSTTSTGTQTYSQTDTTTTSVSWTSSSTRTLTDTTVSPTQTATSYWTTTFDKRKTTGTLTDKATTTKWMPTTQTVTTSYVTTTEVWWSNPITTTIPTTSTIPTSFETTATGTKIATVTWGGGGVATTQTLQSDTWRKYSTVTSKTTTSSTESFTITSSFTTTSPSTTSLYTTVSTSIITDTKIIYIVVDTETTATTSVTSTSTLIDSTVTLTSTSTSWVTTETLSTSTTSTSVQTDLTTITVTETSLVTEQTTTTLEETSISTSWTTETLPTTSVSTSLTTTTLEETSVSTSLTTTSLTSVSTSLTTTTLEETSIETSLTTTTLPVTSVSTSLTTTTLEETSVSTSITETTTSLTLTSVSTEQTTTSTTSLSVETSVSTSLTTTTLEETSVSTSFTTDATTETELETSTTTTGTLTSTLTEWITTTVKFLVRPTGGSLFPIGLILGFGFFFLVFFGYRVIANGRATQRTSTLMTNTGKS